MLPKPSSSEFSSARSESKSRGGVAVLAVLVVLEVTFRSLWMLPVGGRPPGEDAGEDFLPTPKEKERVESRRKLGFAEAGGGAGISFKILCPTV